MKIKMRSILGIVLGVAFGAAALSTGVAQTAAATDPKTLTVPTEKMPPAPASEPITSAITGDFGIAVTNLYDSRGYALVTRGGMFQPYADIYVAAYTGDGFINSITPTLGLWSDVDTDKNFASKPTSDLKSWYEFDYMPGVAIGFAKHYTLTETYLEFDSPSGGFKTARSINSEVSFDDTDMIVKSFSIQPHITLLNELPASGSAGGVEKGEYLELGIAPNYTLFAGSKQPVTLTVPITLAYGDHFYTEGISYGYFSTGLGVSTPLSIIPPQYGNWSVSASYKHFNTGDSVNTPEYRDQDIFSVGVGCKF